MRLRAASAVLALLSGGAAWAQTGTTVVVPPAPPIVSTPLPAAGPAPVAAPAPVAPPPGLVQAQPPVAPASEAPSSGSAATAPVTNIPDTAPVISSGWTASTAALLGVLDKVDGSTAQVSIPVGGQANVGDLQVSVQSCLVRPAGQLPDAAIFLTVEPLANTSGPPLFRGWMVRSTPGATVVGDAGETFRVIGCS